VKEYPFKQKPLKSDYSISPEQKRAQEISQEIISKRASLREVEWRLGTPLEKPDDFERARRLAHDLGGLVQETKLASYLSETKLSAPKTPTSPKGIKKSRPPNFDDNAIQWVGRSI
jgi:hypothetical protein